MKRLDARELDIWLRQAEAEGLDRKMQAMDVARSAWMESEDYVVVVQQMQDHVDKLRRGVTYEEEVRENWDYLKDLGGG